MTANLKKTLTLAGALFLILAVGSYAYYRTRDIRQGVRLEVKGIENYAAYESPLVQISGRALHSTKLTLNGREIFVDRDARFLEPLLLLPGWNIIEVKAEDKLGRQAVKNYQVILN